jgi:hypothetical protein
MLYGSGHPHSQHVKSTYNKKTDEECRKKKNGSGGEEERRRGANEVESNKQR